MSDPFELLRDELVRAAKRTAVATPGHGNRRPRWWRGRQGLAVAMAGLLVAGGAAAAATVLSGEQSKPLSGVVPAGQQPHTALVAGQRYTIGFAPSIQAGQIGWCVSTRTFSRSGRAQDRGTGGCDTPAATAGQPILGTQTIVNGGGLSYVFTSRAVSAVKIAGGPTVLTRPSRRLPDGYRAAVFQYHPPKGALGLTRIPGGAANLVTALSSSGQQITQDSSGPPVEPTRSWLYPDAPRAGACSLATKPGSALRAGSGSVLSASVAAPTVAGAAFLPCVDEDLYLPPRAGGPDASTGTGTFLVGAILLDAAQPGRAPGPLPGMHPIPGGGGIYDMPDADVFAGLASNGLTAKRTANAWVVVAGGSSSAQRTAALNDLIPAVHLASAPASASTPAALCQITYRAVSGLQETTQAAITTTRRIAPRVAAGQAREQHELTAALAKLRHDQAADPRDQAAIASDRAAVSLLQQANFDAIQQDSGLFAPECAQATFYYRQHWPMTATMILATKDCPAGRVPVPCSKRAAAQGTTLTKATRPVPGHRDEFTVAPTAFFHPAETVKQIDKWWLVIQGGASPAQQQLLLDQLDTTVSPKLNAALRGTTPSPAAFCARETPTAC
jgi:hypothetical protein